MNSFYLIDKPIWITSFDVIRKLRQILKIKKIWHTWTLDPLASGLLLIAVWNYTKLIPYFEKDYKTYEFKINLDWTTETYDLEKEISFIWEEEKKYFKENLDINKIQENLDKYFSWNIFQIPPKYSAIKIWWKKALDMIRNWEEFEMKKREINIKSIKILSYNYPELYLQTTVSAWTYIRSIASDLWNILWTWWYVTYLKRTEIWKLNLSLSNKLDNFDINNIIKEKDIFKNNMFFLEDNLLLSDINNWKEINNIFDKEIKDDIFITNKDWHITNILKISWDKLIPKRKII